MQLSATGESLFKSDPSLMASRGETARGSQVYSSRSKIYSQGLNSQQTLTQTVQSKSRVTNKRLIFSPYTKKAIVKEPKSLMRLSSVAPIE